MGSENREKKLVFLFLSMNKIRNDNICHFKDL